MKKTIAIILSIMLILAITLPATAISTVAVKSIKLNASKISLKVGATLDLKVTFTPTNTSQKKLTFITSNKNVATVNSDGVIKGVHEGYTTITVLTLNKKIFAKCKVNILHQKKSLISVFWKAENITVGADNPILQKIEEKANVKIKMLNIPWNSYDEKMNLSISTGDMADIMMTYGPSYPSFKGWVEENVFIPLDKYVADSENIKNAIPNEVMEQMKVNGKIFAIPRLFPNSTHVLFVRKDWLDKFNLKPPVTLEEFYNVGKIFTEQDPDGNGKKDTYGLGSFAQSGLFWLRYLSTAYDVPWDQFRKMDGKWRYCSVVPEAKQWVTFANKLYKEGILDPEFTVIKNTQAKEKFFQGKLGMLGMPFKDYYNAINTLKKVNPQAEVLAIQPPKGPSGKGGFTPVSTSVGYLMAASISKTCKDPEAAVRLLDFLVSKEGGMLEFYGIEGRHYKNDNGRITRTKSLEELAKDGIGPNAPLQIMVHEARYAEAFEPDSAIERQLFDTSQKSFYPIELSSLPMNKNMTEMWAELRDYANENLVNFIVGKRPLNEFDNYVKQWNDKGGQTFLDELEKELAKKLNK